MRNIVVVLSHRLLPSKFMYLVAKMLGVTEGLDDFSGSRKYQ